LVDAGVDIRFPESGGSYIVPSRDWEPPTLDDLERAEAVKYAAALDAYLAPAGDHDIASRIVSLMAHYWTPKMGEAVWTSVTRDWIADLGEFPVWAIEKACETWRRRETKRPMPSELRHSCQTAVRNVRTEREVIRKCIGETQPERRDAGLPIKRIPK
jgi:hypothetical protein